MTGCRIFRKYLNEQVAEKITETRYRAKVSATPSLYLRQKRIHQNKAWKTLPGFRKGKAPDHLILKKYPEQIREQQISRLVYGYLPEVLASENGLSEIIKVENIHLHDDHGAYELIFDTRPYAEIGKVSP